MLPLALLAAGGQAVLVADGFVLLPGLILEDADPGGMLAGRPAALGRLNAGGLQVFEPHREVISGFQLVDGF